MKKFNLKLCVLVCLTTPLISSCVNSDKDMFDADATKKLYESNFPVQNIDPNMDWKTTQHVNVAVAENEDAGENYKIQIFDANPYDSKSDAKLLTEGYASNSMSFITTMDCPKADTIVYVARMDSKNRYLIKPVKISNGSVLCTFGEAKTSAMPRKAMQKITTMSAPYSDSDIDNLLAKSTEVQSGWDLGAMTNWNSKYQGYPEFSKDNNTMRYFKITKDCSDLFTISGSPKMTIVITSKVTFNSSLKLQETVDLVIAKGGELILKDGASFTQSSRLIVLGNSKVTSNKVITLTNAGSAKASYNAGTVDSKELRMETSGGMFYNCGTFKTDYLDITNNETVFVNQGKATIGKTDTNNTIENNCYLIVDDYHGNLYMGNSCAAYINKFSTDWNRKVTLGEGSMVTIQSTAYFGGLTITGPSQGYALFKVNNVTDAQGLQCKGNVYYESNSNSIPETFSNAITTNGTSTLSKYGDSPLVIPAGDCTGAGNKSNESGEVIVKDPEAYSYAFEDNYPMVGDYDFNDIVMDLSTSYVKEKSNNQIKQIVLNVTLRAVGATKKLGAGLRLAGIDKSSISSVAFIDTHNMRNTLANSAFETGATESAGNEVVIPLFGDAHAVYAKEATREMLNTTAAARLPETYTLQVIITPANQTLTSPIISKDNLDFFITNTSNFGNRVEIHLYEFKNFGATANGNVLKQNLDLAGHSTWAICVPNFQYPLEGHIITDAYPKFANWAASRNTDVDWYKYPVSSKIFK